MKDNLIAIAKIVKPHGIKGDAKLISYAEVPESVFNYPCLYDDKLNEYKLKQKSVHESFFIVSINQNTSRNLIEELAGTLLYIDHNLLPNSDDNQYYYKDLVGLTVISQDQAVFGIVLDVCNFGGGDLLEVSIPDKKDTVYLPFDKEFVSEVNLEKKYLIFDLSAAGI